MKIITKFKPKIVIDPKKLKTLRRMSLLFIKDIGVIIYCGLIYCIYVLTFKTCGGLKCVDGWFALKL